MDLASVIWVVLIGAGAIIGVFFRPKTIGLIGVLLFGLAAIGIVVGYGTGKDDVGFMSGVIAMALPFVCGFLILGAAGVRAIFRRDKS